MPNTRQKRILLYKNFLDGVNYDADAQNYFTRAGITNLTEMNAWNTAVVAMKSAGIYAKAIVIYPCSPTSIGASYYNAVSSSFTITSSVPPAFSTDGWTGNGVTQYLRTGIIPNAILTIDNVSFVWRTKTAATRTGVDWGVVDSATSLIYGRSRFTGDITRFAYQTNTSLYDLTNATGAANFIHTANGATSRQIRRNKTSLGTSSAAHAPSPTQPTREIYLLARNNVGTPDLFCALTLNFWGVFIALTNAESDALSDIIDTYNLNVISGGR